MTSIFTCSQGVLAVRPESDGTRLIFISSCGHIYGDRKCETKLSPRYRLLVPIIEVGKKCIVTWDGDEFVLDQFGFEEYISKAPRLRKEIDDLRATASDD